MVLIGASRSGLYQDFHSVNALKEVMNINVPGCVLLFKTIRATIHIYILYTYIQKTELGEKADIDYYQLKIIS